MCIGEAGRAAHRTDAGGADPQAVANLAHLKARHRSARAGVENNAPATFLRARMNVAPIIREIQSSALPDIAASRDRSTLAALDNVRNLSHFQE